MAQSATGTVEVMIQPENTDGGSIVEGSTGEAAQSDQASEADAVLGAFLRAGAQSLHEERPGRCPLLLFGFNQPAVETAYKAWQAYTQAVGCLLVGIFAQLIFVPFLLRMIAGVVYVKENELYVTRTTLHCVGMVLPCLLLRLWSAGTLWAAENHQFVTYCCSATAATLNLASLMNVVNKMFVSDLSSMEEAVGIGLGVGCQSIVFPLGLMLLLKLPFWQTAIPLVGNSLAILISPLSNRCKS